MRTRPLPLLALMAVPCVLGLAAIPASAQAPATPGPAAAGPKNMLRNADMESKPRLIDNLLDGVDKTGKIKAGQISVKVLGASGALSERRMPCSVALADMNMDGKTDVVLGLPEGFIYVYFNEGEATAPKFGHAEILPIFFSTTSKVENEFLDAEIWYDRRVPRIGLGQWSKPGGLDIVMGNLFGQLFFIKSVSNSPSMVTYTQPRNKATAEVPTTKVEGRYWGNLFSPQIVDWDNDGKVDIVMGEGSYSANSVFLMKNKTGTMPPRFTEEDRYFLVTGDGREQLVPAIVDYNGDGRLDVLMSDREGQISVHLRPENWKLGDVLPESSRLAIAGNARRGQPLTIATGDYNMDGLFDILLGEASGQISTAVNTGTAQEPKFDTLTPLTGTDVWNDQNQSISLPPSWDFNDSSSQGNALGFGRVVTNEIDPNAQVPQGNQAFYIGNLTPINKVVQPGPTPNMGEPNVDFRLIQGVTLKNGAKYTVEFMARANKVSNIRVWFESHVMGKTPGKVDVDNRGGVKADQRRPEEHWHESKTFTPGPQWRKMSFSFTARLKNRKIDVKGWGSALRMEMNLNAQDSHVYLDDFTMFEELPPAP